MPGSLANVNRLLRGTDAWRKVFLLNTRSRKKLFKVNISSTAVRAELKSAMNLADAGMADGRLRTVGEAGRTGGSRTLACM